MVTIGRAAALSGVGVETIRYYEREGIVPAPARTASGRRLYDRAGVARLAFVRRCRALGFPIPAVRALLALAGGQPAACAEAAEIGAAHLADVRRRIGELREIEAALAELVALCGAGRAGCPLLRRLAAEG